MSYSHGRVVFGRPISKHPLARTRLAEIAAEHIGGLHLVFTAAAELDRADSNDTQAARRARILIPLAKYTTAKLAVWAASECLELLGGNGYIEDWVMPRLLRDAQVLPVWEGTSNVLVLDVLRTCLKDDSDLALLDHLEFLGGHVGSLRQTAESIRQMDPRTQQVAARAYADALAREASAVYANKTPHAAAQAAARRLRAVPAPFSAGPLTDPQDLQSLLGF